jgi:hypothetical protein
VCDALWVDNHHHYKLNDKVVRHTLSSCDEFVILATDGLWDVLSGQRVADAISSFMFNRSKRAKQGRWSQQQQKQQQKQREEEEERELALRKKKKEEEREKADKQLKLERLEQQRQQQMQQQVQQRQGSCGAALEGGALMRTKSNKDHFFSPTLSPNNTGGG